MDISITFVSGDNLSFSGTYLGQMDTKNWHYYHDEGLGTVIHVRAELILYVESDYEAFMKKHKGENNGT